MTELFAVLGGNDLADLKKDHSTREPLDIPHPGHVLPALHMGSGHNC